MYVGCLPITSLIAITGLIVGFIFSSNEVSIVFWICIGLMIIVLLSIFSIIRLDRMSPKYEPNVIHSSDPNIKLESTNEYTAQFINLSYGKTYIERWQCIQNNSSNNDEDAKQQHIDTYDMILVHGFTTPDEWDPIIKSIQKIQNISSNYKVSSIITYHLYGRGYSDTPLTQNTLQLFTAQLSELLMILNINKPIILVGMSMGGGICAGFAAIFPSKIHKLVLIGPAGLPVNKPLIAKVSTLPFIGDVLMPYLCESELISSFKKEFLNVDTDQYSEDEYNRYVMYLKNWFKWNGKAANYCILSTLRYFPLGEMKQIYYDKLYNNKEFDNNNCIFIWADNDTTCPIENSVLYPNIKVLIVENANHMDVVAHYAVQKWFDDFWNWL